LKGKTEMTTENNFATTTVVSIEAVASALGRKVPDVQTAIAALGYIPCTAIDRELYDRLVEHFASASQPATAKAAKRAPARYKARLVPATVGWRGQS
jgi:hypothetical protein